MKNILMIATLTIAAIPAFAGNQSHPGSAPQAVIKTFLKMANTKGSTINQSLVGVLFNETVKESSLTTVLTDSMTSNRSSDASSVYEIFVGWSGSGYLGSTEGASKFYCKVDTSGDYAQDTITCGTKPLEVTNY
jgi:hypothetical protein